MTELRQIVEEVRDAIDDEGAKECFRRSVNEYAKETGLPVDGLWLAVEGILQGYDTKKLLKRLLKSWGGSEEEWTRWLMLARTRPDCPSP